MPFLHIGLILLMEQILISLSAIIMGLVLGTWSSHLFIPLLEVVYSAAQQVPKFIIVYDLMDYSKVLITTGLTVTISMVILIVQIGRINVKQVIKLGEDS